MKKVEKEIDCQIVSSIRKGPIEGMVIVDGKLSLERGDMPTISFSEAGLKHLVINDSGKIDMYQPP